MRKSNPFFCLISVIAMAGNVAVADTLVSFDGVTGQAEATVESGGSVCPADSSDVCGSALVFQGGTVTVSTNTAADGLGTARFVWYDLSPTAKGGMGASTLLGTPSSDDNAHGQAEWVIVELGSAVSLSGFWMNGNHATLTNNTVEFVVDGTQYSAGCSAGFCDVTFDDFTEAPISDAQRTGTHFAFSAASGVPFYFAGFSFAPAVADASDCQTGPCELVTALTLPDIQLPPNAMVGQLFPETILDPRADSNGRCIGSVSHTDVDAMGNWTVRPGIIIPWWLCGSPFVSLVDTITDFDILSGTVDHTLLDGLPPANDPSFICQQPVVGDLQKQSVFAWIPDDPNDVIEGRVLELTTGCINPARGKSRSLSTLFAGLHIDFGLDSIVDANDVHSEYKTLLLMKLDSLIEATHNARPALSWRNYFRLHIRAHLARYKLRHGRCHKTSRILSSFIRIAERANFANVGFNNQGELLSRADNIKFTNDVKFCPF